MDGVLVLPDIIRNSPLKSGSLIIGFKVLKSFSAPPELQDILPGIFNQLGADNLDNLRKLAEQLQKQGTAGEGAAAGAAKEEEDDDEVPELVAGETFEAAAEEGHAAS